ncbi:hypothetical protein ACO0LM_23280 [Undibacterium sp. Di26W]|uniref:hypothetical protein n=1 Tax=Undibacterium sp. Di26W TaxID=3413035 RepID=UPI003BF08339
MTSLTVSGLPALAWEIGFVIVGALPVWFGAKITDATNPTLVRSVLALFLGTIGSIAGFMIGGPLGIFLAPVSYILSFKFILGTSLVGAFLLGILSLFGYFLMAKLIGGGFSVNEEPKEKVDTQTSFF